MKLVKEIITKTHRIDSTLIEDVKQYHYDSEAERTIHVKYMESQEYSDSGKVRENINSIMKPEYVWFASYFKHEVIG